MVLARAKPYLIVTYTLFLERRVMLKILEAVYAGSFLTKLITGLDDVAG